MKDLKKSFAENISPLGLGHRQKTAKWTNLAFSFNDCFLELHLVLNSWITIFLLAFSHESFIFFHLRNALLLSSETSSIKLLIHDVLR